MLVSFTLRNSFSFKNETTFDMRAVNAYKEHGYNLLKNDGKEKLVKVAAVYGANASGKSNLFSAFNCFVNIVRESMNNSGLDSNTTLLKYFNPYKFDKDNDSSEYGVVVESNGFEYTYGFEFDERRIITEWAYRRNLKTNRNVVLLERTVDEIKFGPSVRKGCDMYRNQIADDTLALTFFSKLKQKTAFHELFDLIGGIVTVSDAYADNILLIDDKLPEVLREDKGTFLQYLKAIDTGIKDIVYVEEGAKPYFQTSHLGEDGEKYSLDLLDESSGTIKSIFLYIHMRNVLMNNQVVIVDELNAKLHPLLLKYIINVFYNSDSKAQLIYTTHDTALLNKDFFRRDQIWFVDKDEFGHSCLKALSDFKIRTTTSYVKDYLGDVYGGIPHLTDFKL